MSDDYYQRLDDQRRDDFRRDQIRQDYRRQDNIDQDNRDWDNRLEERDYQHRVAEKTSDEFWRAAKAGDTAGVIRATMGPGAAADYLRALEAPGGRPGFEHLEDANRAFDAEDYETAHREYMLALIYTPDIPWLMVRNAQSLMRLGREEAAEAELDKVIRKEVFHPLAHFLRGLCRLERRAYAEAAADFTTDLTINPNEAHTLRRRGFCYYMLQRYGEAITDLKAAAQTFKTDARLCNQLGLAYSADDQLDNALAAYARAAELDTKNPVYRSNRGLMHVNLGQPEAAVDEFSAALKLDPQSWRTLADRARCFERMQQHARAVQDLSAAIKLNPLEANLYVDQAYNQFRLGHHKAALRYSDEALRTGGPVRDAHLMRGRVFVQQQDDARALTEFNLEIEDFPEHGYAHLHRGDLFVRTGRKKKARRDYEAALGLFAKQGNEFGQKDARKALAKVS